MRLSTGGLTPVKLHLCSPEFNGQENIWGFMGQNYLSTTPFTGYDAIVGACPSAWNKLATEADRIRLAATREWPNISATFWK
jgi:hypothetical protein